MQTQIDVRIDRKEDQLLSKWGVRDFSEELRFLPAARLKALFHHEHGGRVHLQKLLYNLIWQAYTRIRDGKREPVDGNLRTFWYTDVKPPLSFLGLFQKNLAFVKSFWEEMIQEKSLLAPVQKNLVLPFSGISESVYREDLWLAATAAGKTRASSAQYLYDAMTNVFYDYVSNGIFHFRDFQFVDDYAPFRFMGKKRPNVIFFAEKMGFVRFVQEVNQTYGVTAICLGGEPKLLSSEYFVDDLLKRGVNLSKEFLLLACVDYDPFGYIIAHEFQRQLSFFGIKKSKLEILVTQKIFTDKELDIYPYQLPINNKRMKTIVTKWVKETGGVRGKPYGIQCDIVPKDRLRERIGVALEARGRGKQ